MSAAENIAESVRIAGGAPTRHVDQTTARLDMLARSWLDVQQTRKSLAQRELDDAIVESFAKAEAQLSAALSRTLRQHVLWPWLSQFPGLGGAHTALIIGRIGDPRRFPGQRCTEGHYLPPLYAVGTPCPIAVVPREGAIEDGDGALDARADDARTESEAQHVCSGMMLPPRAGTGVRSLWHWAGLHALETGRAPRKTKGQSCDWEPRVRASVMQQDGIADQIVRHGVRVDLGTAERIARHKYAQIYLAAKTRLMLRVPEVLVESELARGDAMHLRAAVRSGESENDTGRPLKLHEADRIGRKVAAKAFLGDLLTEWKHLCAEGSDAIELTHDVDPTSNGSGTPAKSAPEPSTEGNLHDGDTDA